MVLLKEHDRIVVTQEFPELAVHSGDIGTVVHVYRDNAAVEVEFDTSIGRTCNIAALPIQMVRLVLGNEAGNSKPLRGPCRASKQIVK